MKTRLLSAIFAFAAPALLFTGCTTAGRDARITNPNSPGPAVGNAVGTAVGAVGSNVVGGVVGVGEGVAAATKKTFTNERRVIRTWRTETTSDGRTIKVPVEIEVDENGKPIGDPAAPATRHLLLRRQSRKQLKPPRYPKRLMPEALFLSKIHG